MIDYERAKKDLVYFAIHCIVDAKTGKPFKWSSSQLNQINELNKKENNHEQKSRRSGFESLSAEDE